MVNEILEVTLFKIFTDGLNAQAPDSLGVLKEGLRRLQLVEGLHKPLYLHKSRKNRHCVRGCVINRGERYYRRQPDGLKLCLDCAAVIKDNFLLEILKLQPRLRTHGDWHQWIMRKAIKDYECARQCVIKSGEHYFISGFGQSGYMKLCARCMALVLYFNNVEALPKWGWG